MNYRDKRLMRLIKKALLALENPAKGIIFDDFDLRYCERERKREKDSAAWYYRDKLSFEQKYEAECDSDNNSEPAWVSDNGQGAKTHYAIVSHDLDGDEARMDDPTRRDGRSRTWAAKRDAAIKRVRRNLPHTVETLKLILKNINNRKESIYELTRLLYSSPEKEKLAQKKYHRDLYALLRFFGVMAPKTSRSMTTAKGRQLECPSRDFPNLGNPT